MFEKNKMGTAKAIQFLKKNKGQSNYGVLFIDSIWKKKKQPLIVV